MIFGENVIHTRRVMTGRNPQGVPIYEDVVQPPIYGASFQGIDTLEPNGTASQFRVITEAVLYVPPATSILALDKVTVRGKVYEVQGTPLGETSAFTGFQAHIPVKLKWVSG
ncbi:UNVERIFIED_CONTAM: hypothetical protein Q9R71_17730 [Actinomycetes bacterium ARC8]|nr:hypothetical protein [Actinomycetes bacterium ARC8]